MAATPRVESEIDSIHKQRVTELQKLAKGQISETLGNPTTELCMESDYSGDIYEHKINQGQEKMATMEGGDDAISKRGSLPAADNGVCSMMKSMEESFTRSSETQLTLLSQIANSLAMIDKNNKQTDTNESTCSEKESVDVDDLFDRDSAVSDSGVMNESDCSDTILSELEDLYKEKIEFGPPVNEKLARVVKSAIQTPLTKEQIQTLSEKHLTPTNCPDIRVPKVNKELWEAFKGKHSADLALQNAQKSMCLALVPLIKSIEVMVQKGDTKLVQEFTKDAFRCLAHGLQAINNKRKDLIRPALPMKYRKVTEHEVPVTEMLFGDDLEQRVDELDKQTKRVAKFSSQPFLGQQRYSKEYNPSKGIKPGHQSVGRKWMPQAKVPRHQGKSHPYHRDTFNNLRRK